jgi:adenylate cyclase class 2
VGTEIEKKYRLTEQQRDRVVRRLKELGLESEGQEFEENILFNGPNLDTQTSILRLRRVGERAILTYKHRMQSSTSIRHQREDETGIQYADAMNDILDGLGYKPSLIYEKRRTTWHAGNAEIVLDELPFGLFLEVEGDEDAIMDVEKLLGLDELDVEMSTYPELSQRYGRITGDRIEARFDKSSEDAKDGA